MGASGLQRLLGRNSKALAAPAVKSKDPELAEFEKANIDWNQAKGEHITVMVIPSLFFRVAQEFSPQFTRLTGIRVTW